MFNNRGRDISIRVVGDHAEVPLTKGMIAIIDIEDIPLVDEKSWSSQYNPISKLFYAIHLKQGNKTTYMHRLIRGEYDKSILVDHINHNTLDNRRVNLRSTTYSESNMNRRVKAGFSGYPNVFFCKSHGLRKRWFVHFKKDKKIVFKKSFLTLEEACKVAEEKAKEIHGEFYYSERGVLLS